MRLTQSLWEIAGLPLQLGLRLRYSALMRIPEHLLTGGLDAARAGVLLPVSAGDDHDDRAGNGDEGGQVSLATRTRAKPKKPSQYKVLLMNDDYTPMEFVILVLRRFFRMDMEQATRVMLHVHQRGVGVCGIFPYEVAETKVNQVMDYARENLHPLQCTLEKA